eukprot:GHRQ01020387.1.p3 GENE.GHRQ01020387.1~~GHRQ01020387.1.p3  ORF type:complete len:116 (-),score=24.53 GHRQ01020387.1:681-1028(-)
MCMAHGSFPGCSSYLCTHGDRLCLLHTACCCAGCSMQAQFEQTDQLGLELWQDERQYDAATCMFALHYFFERESSLMTFMQTVAANLKPGKRVLVVLRMPWHSTPHACTVCFKML